MTLVRSFEDVDSGELIEELRQLERAALIRLQGFWFALIVAGAITMFSPGRGGVYWLLAVPAGVALIVRWYRRRELPVMSTTWWCPMVGLWVIGGSNIVAGLSTARSGQIAAYAAVGAGFLALALHERSGILAGTAVATPTLAALIAMVDSAEPPAFPATIGFMWFFVGIVVWLYRY